MQAVIVVDLGELLYRQRKSTLTVTSAAGDELAVVDVGDCTGRLAILRGLLAAQQATVWRAGRERLVLLYNPHTAQAGRGTWLFDAASGVAVGGSCGEIDDRGVLRVEGTVWCAGEPLGVKDVVALGQLA